jgi:hypothetical protein
MPSRGGTRNGPRREPRAARSPCDGLRLTNLLGLREQAGAALDDIEGPASSASSVRRASVRYPTTEW